MKSLRKFEFLSDNCLLLSRNSFLVGFPFTVAIVGIPQRFQAVNGISPFGAGYRLLPFAVLTPVGAALAGPLTSKLRIPPLYVLLLGTICQTVGAALLSTLPTTVYTVLAAQYGYQVILGFGCGLNLTILVLLAPSVAKKEDVGSYPLPLHQWMTSLSLKHNFSCGSRCCQPISSFGRGDWLGYLFQRSG